MKSRSGQAGQSGVPTSRAFAVRAWPGRGDPPADEPLAVYPVTVADGRLIIEFPR
jgi:hypothetical protein